MVNITPPQMRQHGTPAAWLSGSQRGHGSPIWLRV
jgi:hypothetical protein